MVFEVKKIKIETLNEYLIEIRQGLGWTIEQVAERTGIKPEYINALETGIFKVLPPNVYVCGFLRQLADAYGIPGETLVNQFKKERGIAEAPPTEIGNHWFKGFWGRLVITPKLISLAVGGFFVLLTLVYVIFEIAFINVTPALAIEQPGNNQVVHSTAVTVSGTADVGSTVLVNNQKVFTNPAGKFTAQVSLVNGPNNLMVTAQNKFGKEKTKQLMVMVDSNNVATPQQPQVAAAVAENPFTLQLHFSKAADLNLTVDGVVYPQEAILAGADKIITAKTKVLLGTSDAGALSAQVNNRKLGTLGKNGEILTDVPFTADSGTVVAGSGVKPMLTTN